MTTKLSSLQKRTLIALAKASGVASVAELQRLARYAALAGVLERCEKLGFIRLVHYKDGWPSDLGGEIIQKLESARSRSPRSQLFAIITPEGSELAESLRAEALRSFEKSLKMKEVDSERSSGQSSG